MTMKYKLVIFDFDGTLADTFPWFADIINKVAEKYHFKKITPDEHETIRGFDARGVLKYLGVPLWKMPLIANYIRMLMTHDIQRIALFQGIENVLRRLADLGATLAVVSSNSYENIQHVLGAELATLIAYYECGVSMFGKEAKLRKILKRSGFSPDEAIYIGDEIRDNEAAKKTRARLWRCLLGLYHSRIAPGPCPGRCLCHDRRYPDSIGRPRAFPHAILAYRRIEPFMSVKECGGNE